MSPANSLLLFEPQRDSNPDFDSFDRWVDEIYLVKRRVIDKAPDVAAGLGKLFQGEERVVMGFLWSADIVTMSVSKFNLGLDLVKAMSV